ncbi:TPA: hypothetical protein ACH3X2_005371 [Trebouxia sp. C0005]
MPFQQVSSRRQRSFKLRQRRDRIFFEAMEGCADFERLTVRPLFTYSPPVVAVRFGHLYKGDASQRDVEGLVWQSILTQLPHQLIAMDPQRLGTPTAAYDLHFQEQFLQQKHDLFNRGFLTVEYLGKREQLPASSKGSQMSPRYAEVVVKQLDPRWARKGVTAALLKAAGYSTDVTVQTEFVGDLPAHLSCWSNHLGRSDVTVAKVAAPASDPSLRKLPRSIQFQGLSARRKAKKVKRQASKQQSGQRQASPPQLARSGVASTQPAMEQQGLVPDDEPLLTAIFPLPGGITSLPIVEGPPAALARLHPAPSSGAGGLGSPLPVASSPRASMPDAASPLAGKRRGPESVSDVESLGAIEAPTADSLALVPLTPDDSHAPSLRRSSRDHKKPRPYYAASQVEPPDKPSTSKGLQRGFLK